MLGLCTRLCTGALERETCQHMSEENPEARSKWPWLRSCVSVCWGWTDEVTVGFVGEHQVMSTVADEGGSTWCHTYVMVSSGEGVRLQSVGALDKTEY